MLTVSFQGIFRQKFYSIENYLRDLLVIQKKGTERYRMVRNALIVFLATVKEMMLPNIADEAGVSIYTIKNVMKASKNVRQ